MKSKLICCVVSVVIVLCLSCVASSVFALTQDEVSNFDYDRELERIAGLVDPGWSDLEKAWYFHDYLTRNFTYDDEKEYHSAAMLFLSGKGVCESFSLAYQDLLAQWGIESHYVSAPAMDHGWNVVKIEGKWYHVDVTWDLNRGHENFLLSDGDMMGTGHSNWSSPVRCEESYPQQFTDFAYTHTGTDNGGEDLAEGDFTYQTIAKIGISILTGYTGEGGTVEIPESLGGYPAVTVGYKAFAENESITSVRFPGSVKRVGMYAFADCANLSGITIEGQGVHLGQYGFANCTSLMSADVDSMGSAGSHVFSGCTGLKTARISGIQGGEAFITGQMFSGCHNLEEVQLPSGLWKIETEAFAGCQALSRISLCQGITTIRSKAFMDCASLETLDIPQSVIEINTEVFRGCAALASLTLPQDLQVLQNGAFSGCGSLREMTLPPGITKVAPSLFEDCGGLNTVIFEGDVTDIGKYAFENCVSLSGLSLPETLNVIDNGAFAGCIGLLEMTVPESVSTMGIRVFEGCAGLTSVRMPEGITTLSDYLFSGCMALREVKFSSSLKATGAYTFEN